MILFVDDEERRMDSYVEELKRSGKDIKFEKNVDQAFDFFDKNKHLIELLILDVMMPTGNIFEVDNTNYGLTTGINFYKKAREILLNIPIIIFTNMFDDKIEEFISDDPNVYFLHKEDYLPLDFVDEVEKIFNLELKSGDS